MITVIFYLFIVIIATVLFDLSLKYKKNHKIGYYRICFYLSIVILSLVSAFRGETGTDSPMYIRAYISQVFDRIDNSDFEIGYQLLNSMLYKIGFPYQVLFFLISFIQSTLIFKSIEKFSNIVNVKLSCFIYCTTFYFLSFNIMRQCFAMSICFYAITMYVLSDKEGIKNKILSILLILLAAQFHRTSYIVLVLPIADFIYKNRKHKLITFSTFAVILFLVFNRSILNSMYAMITGSSIWYLTADISSGSSWVVYFVKISIPIIILILGFKIYSNHKGMLTLSSLTIVGFLFGTLEYITNTQVGRIGQFFSCLQIITVSYSAKQGVPLLNKGIVNSKQVRYILYIYYIMLFIHNYVIKNFGETIPYLPFI